MNRFDGFPDESLIGNVCKARSLVPQIDFEIERPAGDVGNAVADVIVIVIVGSGA